MPQTTTPIEIEIEIEGELIRGTLLTTTIAASFAELLPLRLQFEDYGQQEKIATLPTTLDTTDARAGSSAPAATIAYYAPANALVLYYEDVGHYTGIMPVGTFDDVGRLRAITSDFTATIRRTG